jgi:hypothetical protein
MSEASIERRKLRNKTEKMRKYKRDYYHRNSKKSDNVRKRQVRRKVRTSVDNGTIKKMPCEVCGEARSEQHHDDYDKPLEVRWLCHKHHAEHHKIKRRSALYPAEFAAYVEEEK